MKKGKGAFITKNIYIFENFHNGDILATEDPLVAMVSFSCCHFCNTS